MNARCAPRSAAYWSVLAEKEEKNWLDLELLEKRAFGKSRLRRCRRMQLVGHWCQNWVLIWARQTVLCKNLWQVLFLRNLSEYLCEIGQLFGPFLCTCVQLGGKFLKPVPVAVSDRRQACFSCSGPDSRQFPVWKKEKQRGKFVNTVYLSYNF